MFGMKDDGMRAMRLKAKSKYLDDLLEDNDGKMAVEIKKVYAKPTGVPAANGLESMSSEEEGEESKTGENEMGEEGPGLSEEMMASVDKLIKMIEEKSAPQPEDKRKLAKEEAARIMKELDLENLLKFK